MELNRRNFLTAAGLGVGGLLLGACGSGGGTGGGGGGTGRVSILTPEFAGTAGKETFEGTILSGFPDTSFAVDYTDWNRLNEKLSAAVAGGVVADLIMLGAGWVEPFAHKGVLAELPDSLADGKAINENLFKVAGYEGTTYAMPYFVDGRILMYHREMFDKAGISEDALPTNLEDFREMLKEVKPDGGVAIDLFTQNLRQVWAHLLGAFGGSMFSEDGMSVAFTDGSGVDALQYLLDLVDDGTIDFSVQGAEGQPRPWQQKVAAIDLQNSSAWPSLTEQTPELVTPESMGMMLLPSADGGDPVMFQGGTLLAVSSRSKDPELVQELVSFLLEPENMLPAVEMVGKVPSRDDLDDPIVTDNLMATYIIDNFEYATAYEGGSPAWMEVRGAVEGEIEAAVVGQKTAAEAIDALASLANDALTRV